MMSTCVAIFKSLRLYPNELFCRMKKAHNGLDWKEGTEFSVGQYNIHIECALHLAELDVTDPVCTSDARRNGHITRNDAARTSRIDEPDCTTTDDCAMERTSSSPVYSQDQLIGTTVLTAPMRKRSREDVLQELTRHCLSFSQEF